MAKKSPQGSLALKDSSSTKRELKAFLEKGSEFEGKLIFEGTVRLNGKFTGEIVTHDILIIGEDAEIYANIDAGNVISSGKINGNIIAREKLEILCPGVVVGNIETPCLNIQDGVIFDGNCKMALPQQHEPAILSRKKNEEEVPKPHA